MRSGCKGAAGCSCKEYAHVVNTDDCYTCGHLPKDHVGLGRVSVSSGELLNKTF